MIQMWQSVYIVYSTKGNENDLTSTIKRRRSLTLQRSPHKGEGDSLTSQGSPKKGEGDDMTSEGSPNKIEGDSMTSQESSNKCEGKSMTLQMSLHKCEGDSMTLQKSLHVKGEGDNVWFQSSLDNTEKGTDLKTVIGTLVRPANDNSGNRLLRLTEMKLLLAGTNVLAQFERALAETYALVQLEEDVRNWWYALTKDSSPQESKLGNLVLALAKSLNKVACTSCAYCVSESAVMNFRHNIVYICLSQKPAGIGGHKMQTCRLDTSESRVHTHTCQPNPETAGVTDFYLLDSELELSVFFKSNKLCTSHRVPKSELELLVFFKSNKLCTLHRVPKSELELSVCFKSNKSYTSHRVPNLEVELSVRLKSNKSCTSQRVVLTTLLCNTTQAVFRCDSEMELFSSPHTRKCGTVLTVEPVSVEKDHQQVISLHVEHDHAVPSKAAVLCPLEKRQSDGNRNTEGILCSSKLDCEFCSNGSDSADAGNDARSSSFYGRISDHQWMSTNCRMFWFINLLRLEVRMLSMKFANVNTVIVIVEMFGTLQQCKTSFLHSRQENIREYFENKCIEQFTSDPVNSEADDPVNSETNDPVNSKTDDPVSSETDDPVNSEADDPVSSETNDPVSSKTDDPVNSETDDPVNSETDDDDSRCTDDLKISGDDVGTYIDNVSASGDDVGTCRDDVISGDNVGTYTDDVISGVDVSRSAGNMNRSTEGFVNSSTDDICRCMDDAVGESTDNCVRTFTDDHADMIADNSVNSSRESSSTPGPGTVQDASQVLPEQSEPRERSEPRGRSRAHNRPSDPKQQGIKAEYVAVVSDRDVPGLPQYPTEKDHKLGKADKSAKEWVVDFSGQFPVTADNNLNLTVAMQSDQPKRQSDLAPKGLMRNSMEDTAARGMENEWCRLATFMAVVPPDGVFILPIANTGFYLYSSEGDQGGVALVQCAFCRVRVPITDFQHKVALEVHRQVAPSCTFVSGQNTANVSISGTIPANQFIDREFRSGGTVMNGNGMSDMSPIASHTALTVPDAHPHTSLSQAQDVATDSDAVYSFQDRSASMPTYFLSGPECTGVSSSSATSSPQPPPPKSAPAGSAGVAPPASTQSASQSTASSQASSLPQTGNTTTTSSSGNNLPSPPATSLPTSQAPAPTTSTTSGAPPPEVNSVSGGTAREEPVANSTSPSSGSPDAEQWREGSESRERDGNSGTSERAQDRQLVTYEELGIFTQQPKRPDMVVKQVRVNTFIDWPHPETHPPDQMAEAGFYYTGHEDLVRCFHCKGGLKTWESSDKPWVEHSRWFPRCPFVRLCKGQRFVDAVKNLNNPDTRPTITEDEVEREMQRMDEVERRLVPASVHLLSNEPPVSPDSDPTMGPLARAALRVDAEISPGSLTEIAEKLEDENEEMRDSFRCKMCQVSDVNILFLPCGHLVACSQCAAALRRCAMCRQEVKGSVHVHLDDKRRSGSNSREDSSDSGVGSQGTAAV